MERDHFWLLLPSQRRDFLSANLAEACLVRVSYSSQTSVSCTLDIRTKMVEIEKILSEFLVT